MDKKRLDLVLSQKEDLINTLRSRGIDEKIINNTISDITRRQNRYFDNEGKEGLYQSDEKWLAPLLRGEFITLNSFRFQIFPMNYQEIERNGFDYLPLTDEDKNKFPENLMCINVHIPDGADLSNQNILIEAESFFKKHFPEHIFKYFVIRSWLVYPPMKDILDKDSRISLFMNHFEPVALSHTNKIQPCSKIFGITDEEEIKSREWETSLQRNAKEHFDKLGVAFSYRPFNY